MTLQLVGSNQFKGKTRTFSANEQHVCSDTTVEKHELSKCIKPLAYESFYKDMKVLMLAVFLFVFLIKAEVYKTVENGESQLQFESVQLQNTPIPPDVLHQDA